MEAFVHRLRLVLLTATFLQYVCPQNSDNTPPVMWLDRTWRIPSTEKVGSVVTRVRADDAESDTLEFGLESITGGPIPFSIDNSTGVVYLNESVTDRVGENMFLYVTVSDGKLTAKNEVWVTIVNGTAGIRPPSNGPHRPPYLQLPPGFMNSRPLPPPPSIPSNLNPFNFNGAAINNYPSIGFQPPSTIFSPNISGNFSPNHKVQTKTYMDSPDNGTSVSTSTTKTKTYSASPNDNSTILPTVSSPVGNHSTPVQTEKAFEDTTKYISDIVSNDIDNAENKNKSLSDAGEVVKSNHNVTFTIIPIVVVIFVFIGVGVLSFFVWKKFCFKKTKSKEDMSKEPSGGIVLQEDPSVALQGWRGPRAFSNRYEPWENGHIQATEQSTLSTEKVSSEPEDRWEFPRHRLRVFNIVGEGAFGQVWRCDATDIDGLKGVSTVAVKTLKENASEKEKLDLVQELNVMKALEHHPNVVRLLGCCTEKEPVFVIMEYISLGKLQSYLRSSRAERYYGNTHGCSKTLTSRDLTSFAYQVARGMDFLSSKGIIHRDLAARNVLVNDEHTCKVADFGFARDVLASHIYERKSDGRLPIRWMAPESLYDDIFSVKSDVWSFGVFLWEVVTLGSTPYPGLSAGDVMRKVRDGHRLEKPEHCRRELYNIMYYCWDADPAQRPSFSECVSLLERLLMTETDYIELERFPDHSYYNVSSLSGEKL